MEIGLQRKLLSNVQILEGTGERKVNFSFSFFVVVALDRGY